MAERAGIFDGLDETPEAKAAKVQDFDVSKFRPKPAAAADNQPSVEALREVSEQADFHSREPAATRKVKPKQAASKTLPAPAPAPRRLRRKRTGRSLQLNLKTDQTTLESFYELADSHGWVLGETLEKAVAALKRELAARK